MLTVHHLNNSRSQRVLWLLEELGVPYEIKRYQRDPKTMLAPPELRAVHPLGKSPVITDDGQTIAESGAIIEYLIGKYGQGRFAPAPGTPERLRYTYWLHYAEGSAMPPLLLKLVALRIASAPMPFFAKPIARKIAGTLQSSFIDPQLKLHLGYINKELKARFRRWSISSSVFMRGRLISKRWSAAASTNCSAAIEVCAALEIVVVGPNPRVLD
jgi:glutathione S-transferase